MPVNNRKTLWTLIAAAGLPPARVLVDAAETLFWGALANGTSIEIDAQVCRGRCVLIMAARQLAAATAMMELDGVARRVVLCPPDLPAAQLPDVAALAGVDLILYDAGMPAPELPGIRSARCGLPIQPAAPRATAGEDTEWVLFTSGTTGRPKLVIHTLPSLTGPLDDGMAVARDAVWSTFYDIRRYGGLQILLRACLGGASMVFADTRETLAEFLSRAGANRVTHISGTPSHWRRALMSGAAGRMAPDYVRLSGEVADQPILNSLRAAFPRASIAHAFASTEAGVAFDVRDGLAGFPAALIDAPGGKTEMQVRDGSLRIRSTRVALRYIGDHAPAMADAEGFVDTGDMLDLRDGRYYFVGRREGIINVGGQKVHPEEVEAVVNTHDAVRMCRVLARRSPITGAIVVAEILLEPGHDAALVKDDLLELCRLSLAPHKIPVIFTAVDRLDIGAAGKLDRRVQPGGS